MINVDELLTTVSVVASILGILLATLVLTGCQGQLTPTYQPPASSLSVLTCAHEEPQGTWLTLQIVHATNGMAGAVAARYHDGDQVVTTVGVADEYPHRSFGYNFTDGECHE